MLLIEIFIFKKEVEGCTLRIAMRIVMGWRVWALALRDIKKENNTDRGNSRNCFWASGQE
jgi:hypothetical protein